MSMTPDHECPPIQPLVADVISGMLAETQSVTSEVLDRLTRQNERLQATIDIIRDGIENELDGPYMPVPRILMRRLRPSDEEIDGYIENVLRSKR